jgi:hypothetical protein
MTSKEYVHAGARMVALRFSRAHLPRMRESPAGPSYTWSARLALGAVHPDQTLRPPSRTSCQLASWLLLGLLYLEIHERAGYAGSMKRQVPSVWIQQAGRSSSSRLTSC